MAERVETKQTPQATTGSSAGIIILQWLTYAFWGWTLLSLVWLVFIVLASFITSEDTSGIVPYAIAATLVLLPLSLICDIFYSRFEPAKKSGASMVVMVIHAVIFALFGIGMLISAVLTLVQLLIGTSDSDFQYVWLWTSLISALIYALTFLRTLNPTPKLRLKIVFPVTMAVIVGVFIVLGFVGPVAQASLTRDDRDIESSVDDVSRAVNRYVSSNDKLPATLNDVALRGKAKEIVDRGLVEYKAEGLAPKTVSPNNLDNDDSRSITRSLADNYRYQLCVEYKKEDDNGSQYDDESDSEYSRYISTSGHPAGKVCYKVEARS